MLSFFKNICCFFSHFLVLFLTFQGKGYPDVKTLEVLHDICIALPDIPFFALVDADPYGVDILLTYAVGPIVCFYQFTC